MRLGTLMGALLAVCTVGLAHAADLPAKAPVYTPAQVVGADWSGFYVGGNVGWAFSNEDTSLGGNNVVSRGVVGTGVIPSHFDTRGNGFVYGGQIGYNYQIGLGVVGIEADIQGVDVNQTATHTLSAAPLGIPVSLSSSAEQSIDWFGTLRGRFGAAFGNDLFYVTGGLAYGHVNGSTAAALVTPVPALNAVMSASVDGIRYGWTAGAGMEHKLPWTNWSAKVEYLYIDLGSEDLVMGASVLGQPVSFTAHQDYQFHVARAGLNYKF